MDQPHSSPLDLSVVEWPCEKVLLERYIQRQPTIYVGYYEVIIKATRKYTSDTADTYFIYYYHNNISFFYGGILYGLLLTSCIETKY